MKRLPYPSYKASGVEWLGEIPSEWNSEVLKRRATVLMGQSPPSEEYSNDTDQLPFLQGNAEFGNLSPTPKWFCDSAPKRAQAGSILLSVRAPVGAINQADRLYGIGRGLCSVLAGPGSSSSGFIWYALQAARPLLEAQATGSTFTAISADEVGNFRLAFPVYGEQARIAEFLDRETARIDLLIAKKRELIERLKEKRTALISHVVTKGLPPEEAVKHGLPVNPPLKPSGVPWLGDIPEHWVVLTYKRVCERVFVGIAEAATHAYCDEGTPIIRSTNVKPNRLETNDVLHVERWFAEQNRSKRLSPGDLLTVRTGYPGTTAVVPMLMDGAQCFTLVVSTPRRDTNPDYYAYLFNSSNGRSYFETEGWGTAQTNISVPIVQFMAVPRPPLPEQLAIAAYIELRANELDSLRDKVIAVIQRLQEYRSALITAAVTGKIDVRPTTIEDNQNKDGTKA